MGTAGKALHREPWRTGKIAAMEDAITDRIHVELPGPLQHSQRVMGDGGASTTPSTLVPEGMPNSAHLSVALPKVRARTRIARSCHRGNA
jgi:hypothetical protein